MDNARVAAPLYNLRVLEQKVQRNMHTEAMTVSGQTVSRLVQYREYAMLRFTDGTFCVLRGLRTPGAGVVMQIVQQTIRLDAAVFEKTGVLTSTAAEKLRMERGTLELIMHKERDRDQLRQMVREHGWDAIHQMLQEVQ